MSFINPIFLFAAAAAALPVLFHLVRKRKARTVPFSSLMFLKATPKELVRRRRLTDLLLMAARVAVLILLALAFARPYVPADQIPLLPEDRSESVVLLIDRSMSMQYGDTFSRALDAAHAHLERAGPGDEFAIVAFSDAPQTLTALGGDLATHRAALAGLEPDFRTTSFRTALQRAQDLLRDARHDRRMIVLISDLQMSGWEGTADWKLANDIELITEFVGADPVFNASVEDIRIAERRRGGTSILQYDVGIAAAGESEGSAISAALVVDDREVERRDLPQRDAAATTFQHASSREGYQQGRVELEADGLATDDRFYFTYRVAPMPGVLLVGSSPDAPGSDAFFLARAFDLEEDARFRFETSPSVSGRALDSYDVIFLTGYERVADRDLDRLLGFVEDGGTVVAMAGADASPESFARIAAHLEVGHVGELVAAREEFGYEAIIGQVDERHPVFQPFASGTSGAIFQPRFRRYVRLEPNPESRVVARFDTGDPMLVERTIGAGRALVFTSSMSTRWTDLPLDEMFVPFVYGISQYGSTRRSDDLVFTVGEPVRLAGEPGSTLEVRDPAGKIFRVDVDASGVGYFRSAERPGHYAVSAGGGVQMFSVNVDPAESKLHFRNEQEVYASVLPKDAGDEGVARTAASAVVETDEREQKLWRALLIVVLVLFMVETYFANRRTGREQTSAQRTQERGGRRPARRTGDRRREIVG